MKTVKEEQGGRVQIPVPPRTPALTGYGAGHDRRRSWPEQAGKNSFSLLRSSGQTTPRKRSGAVGKGDPTARLLLEGGVAVEYSAGGQTALRRSSGAAGVLTPTNPVGRVGNPRRERSRVGETPGAESGVEY